MAVVTPAADGRRGAKRFCACPHSPSPAAAPAPAPSGAPSATSSALESFASPPSAPSSPGGGGAPPATTRSGSAGGGVGTLGTSNRQCVGYVRRRSCAGTREGRRAAGKASENRAPPRARAERARASSICGKSACAGPAAARAHSFSYVTPWCASRDRAAPLSLVHAASRWPSGMPLRTRRLSFAGLLVAYRSKSSSIFAHFAARPTATRSRSACSRALTSPGPASVMRGV